MKKCLLIFIVYLNCSCSTENNSSNIDKYLVLGHTYQWHLAKDKVDKNLESKSFKDFLGIWLGGDMCAETSQDESTFKYLDKLFDLSSKHTLWAVGNHDIRNGNLALFEKYTHRPFYHSYDNKSLRVITINTLTEHNIFKQNCEWKKAQYDFLMSELDQALKDENLKHLVLFTHQTIWDSAEAPMDSIKTIGNQKANWINLVCEQASNFRQVLLDPLSRIQKSGIQVHCVAGDGGQYLKTFNETGPSGIKYYLTGINNSVFDTEINSIIERYNTAPDSVLIFEYHHENNDLLGKFIPLSSL